MGPAPIDTLARVDGKTSIETFTPSGAHTMNIGQLLDEESIWMSFWRRHRQQVDVRQDLIRRDRNRRDEADDDERERIAVAEDHARLMKKLEARKAAETQQALKDLRAEQSALRAWQSSSSDRRDY
jgi:hypothetical protein